MFVEHVCYDNEVAGRSDLVFVTFNQRQDGALDLEDLCEADLRELGTFFTTTAGKVTSGNRKRRKRG